MLLRFGVSNFLSIKDYQEVSLIASSLKDSGSHLCEVEGFSEKVLPAVAIYGANASGKSNILKALNFMVSGILNSHRTGRVEGGIRRNFFKLDQQYKAIESKFDCDFIHNNVRYHFGYVIDDNSILEEWLYAYPLGTRQVWYHRKNDGSKMYFGKFLKGKNKIIESLTRPNSLFISTAAENNHEQLLELYKFFKNKFIFSFNNFGSLAKSSKYLVDENVKDKIISFIRYADTGIISAKVEQVEEPGFMAEFNKKLNDIVFEQVDEKVKVQVEASFEREKIAFSHRGVNGEEVLLDIKSESRGTIALIKMLGPIFDCLDNGKTIIIDELDTSMHSLLSSKLVSLFSNTATNPICAQLIFSTHDTSILSSDFLRRDEIWFTEKNCEGATDVYSLADIKSRQTDNFEKGYLQGRYGGVPYLGNIDDLLEGGGSEA
jgi:AAA15 family ATPase/GTPase